MKKLNRVVRGLALLTLFASLVLRCSKDDSGGSAPMATEPEEITITASNLATSVDENPAQGATLGRVQASASSGSLTFTIVMQSVAGALSINSSNGDLSVADPALFDFETHQQITATIRISAGNTTQEVNVTITINDVNEVDVSTLTLWEGCRLLFLNPTKATPPMLPTKTVLPTTYGLPEEIRACCTILSQNLQQTMHLAQQEQNGHKVLLQIFKP